jgi:hypothetical protein
VSSGASTSGSADQWQGEERRVCTGSLVEENDVQGRKFGLGGDLHFIYRVVVEEWRGGLAM